jgi:hypothetical protein
MNPDPLQKPGLVTQERPSALVAIMAWAVPGLGHWFIGERARALIFFVVISVTFWGGVAVGGVRSTVHLKDNGAWIAAQLCLGPQALAALYLSNQDQQVHADKFKAPWPAANISVVYTGIAGLLNLLIIIDSLSRADAVQPETSRSPPLRADRRVVRPVGRE